MKKNENVKNVYELTQERLAVLFKEFDNIYVSFSGGKDSGVLLNLCIDYIRRNNLNIKLGVFLWITKCSMTIPLHLSIAFWNRIRMYLKFIGFVYPLRCGLVLPCISITGVHGMRPFVTSGYERCRKGL